MLLLKGHLARPIYALAFSPDGTRLASCCLDKTVRLWDCATGQGKSFAGRFSHSVAFAPDGNTLAWSVSSSSILLLDLATEQVRSIKTGHGGWPKIRFAPDGRTLALVGSSVRCLDVSTGTLLPEWKGNNNATGCLAYSPDGSILATGARFFRLGSILQIKLWSPIDGRPLGELSGHTYAATDLAFAPSGRALAAACGPSLWVWDVPGSRSLLTERIDARHFQGVAFSPDGRWLASAHNDQTVRFFDTLTWREHSAFDWQIGSVVAIAFAPDGMRAAAASNKGKIVVWDVDL